MIGGVKVSFEVPQRLPGWTSGLMGYPSRVKRIEPKAGRGQPRDEPRLRHLRRSHHVPEDLMDRPLGAQRLARPLLIAELLQVRSQGTAFGMDQRPGIGRCD